MPTVCCVPLCKNRSGHIFPWSDPSRVKAWVNAIKRDKWQPKRHSVVCKSHFDENDYITLTTSGN